MHACIHTYIHSYKHSYIHTYRQTHMQDQNSSLDIHFDIFLEFLKNTTVLILYSSALYLVNIAYVLVKATQSKLSHSRTLLLNEIKKSQLLTTNYHHTRHGEL